MKKTIEKIKKQAVDEAMKAGLVFVGTLGGTLVINGIRKYTADNPTMDAIAEYALPVLFAGGGIILSSATDANSKLKYVGYGLTVAGVFKGIQIIPVAKEYLGNILGNTEIEASSAFYTESEEGNKIMNGFGLASVSIGNVTMQEIPRMNLNLPDLQGASNNLSYNATVMEQEDDVSGIL